MKISVPRTSYLPTIRKARDGNYISTKLKYFKENKKLDKNKAFLNSWDHKTHKLCLRVEKASHNFLEVWVWSISTPRNSNIYSFHLFFIIYAYPSLFLILKYRMNFFLMTILHITQVNWNNLLKGNVIWVKLSTLLNLVLICMFYSNVYKIF